MGKMKFTLLALGFLGAGLLVVVGVLVAPNGQAAEQKMVLMHEGGGGTIDDPAALTQLLERGSILEDGDGRLCVVQATLKETGWLYIVCSLGEMPVPREAEKLNFRFIYTRDLSGIHYHHKAQQFLEQE